MWQPQSHYCILCSCFLGPLQNLDKPRAMPGSPPTPCKCLQHTSHALDVVSRRVSELEAVNEELRGLLDRSRRQQQHGRQREQSSQQRAQAQRHQHRQQVRDRPPGHGGHRPIRICFGYRPICETLFCSIWIVLLLLKSRTRMICK